MKTFKNQFERFFYTKEKLFEAIGDNRIDCQEKLINSIANKLHAGLETFEINIFDPIENCFKKN